MTLAWARTACSHPALSGISRAHIGELLEELAPRWKAARESALRRRRGGDRRRAAGAGPKQRLVFVDRLLVTLVHLRLGLPHATLAELYGVDRSTVSNAVREVRALLAVRGFAVPDRPGIRLRTLEDVFADADAEGACLRIGGTEVQVRRPKAGRPGRRAFISGKKKQNTINPHPGLVPVPQPAPARHPGSEAELLRQPLPLDPGVQHAQDAPQATTVVQWQRPGRRGRRCLTGSNGSIRPHRSFGTIHGGPFPIPITRSTSRPGKGYGYDQAFC